MRKSFALAGLMSLAFVSPTFATVSGELDPAATGPPASIFKSDLYDTKNAIIVVNWVLCISESFAEDLAKARSQGYEAALATYNSYVEQKDCGMFPEMQLILRETVYRSEPGYDYDAQVFRASINFGDEWLTGFVVKGSTDE